MIISALAAALLLSGCGGSKTTSGGGSGDEAGARTARAARAPAAIPPAPTEEPDTTWYNTQDSEFWISKAGQMAGLAQLVNRGNRFAGKTVKLTADIDLSGYGSGASSFNNGKGWIPIGAGLNMFKGVFDGDGKTVRRLFINDAGLFHAGLFGRVDGGTVKNLGVVDANITAGGRTGAIAGGLNGGTVEQCYSTGTVKGKGFVGGVVGHVARKSTVTGCYSSASVHGENYVGGVVGDADGGSTVSRSYFTGEEVRGNEAVGGVAGGVLGKGSSISNTYSTGAIVCGATCGGVVGKVQDGASAVNSYSTGAVSGRTRAGGVVGQITAGAVTGCVAINPSVKVEGRGGFTGRVFAQGDGRTSGGNLAFSGIKNSADGTDWPAKGDKARDGVDITAAQISSDGTIGGRFTETNGWTTMRGMLPGFGAAVRVPEHMK
jgi:hypothetical protein